MKSSPRRGAPQQEHRAYAAIGDAHHSPVALGLDGEDSLRAYSHMVYVANSLNPEVVDQDETMLFEAL